MKMNHKTGSTMNKESQLDETLHLIFQKRPKTHVKQLVSASNSIKYFKETYGSES
jgi:hypothetical protein